MATTDKRKQSLYLPDDIAAELRAEAERLNQPLSWVFQQAWKLAQARVSRLSNWPAAAPRPEAKNTTAGVE
jgi:uncharacterized small protein (TIGR04563 family)